MLYQFHKQHHHFTNIKPFTSNITSPVEIIFFILLIKLPYRLFTFSSLGYYFFVLIMIMTGLFDHTNIKIKLPFYNSMDHAIHHKLPHRNYGFPLLIFDEYYGTALKALE